MKQPSSKSDSYRSDNYRMQSVSFRNIEEFLEYLPEDELKIVLLLRKLIYDSSPFIKEKLSYNVPFYFLELGV